MLSFIEPERGEFDKILHRGMIYPKGELKPGGKTILRSNILSNSASGGFINDILYRNKLEY